MYIWVRAHEFSRPNIEPRLEPDHHELKLELGNSSPSPSRVARKKEAPKPAKKRVASQLTLPGIKLGKAELINQLQLGGRRTETLAS